MTTYREFYCYQDRSEYAAPFAVKRTLVAAVKACRAAAGSPYVIEKTDTGNREVSALELSVAWDAISISRRKDRR